PKWRSRWPCATPGRNIRPATYTSRKGCPPRRSGLMIGLASRNRKRPRRMSRADQSKDAPLRADIHRLGDLTGETLKRFGGERLFQIEENVRALCKQLRGAQASGQASGKMTGEGADAAERELKHLLRRLNLDETIGVIRAFSVYFQLVNIAE